MRIVKLVLDIGDDFGRQLLRGIYHYSRLYGPWCFQIGYFPNALEPNTERKRARSAIPEEPDGVIAYIDNLKIAQKAFPRGLPIIAIPLRHPIPGVPNIILDVVSIGKLAAQHLLEA